MKSSKKGVWNHKPGCKCLGCRNVRMGKSKPKAKASRARAERPPQEPAQRETQPSKSLKVESIQPKPNTVESAPRPADPAPVPEQKNLSPESEKYLESINSGTDKAVSDKTAKPTVLKDETAHTVETNPAPLPGGATETADVPATTVKAEKSIMVEILEDDDYFAAKCVVNGPYELANVFLNTAKFTLTKDEALSLAKQLMNISRLFGFRLDNKWIAVGVFMVCAGKIGARGYKDYKAEKKSPASKKTGTEKAEDKEPESKETEAVIEEPARKPLKKTDYPGGGVEKPAPDHKEDSK